MFIASTPSQEDYLEIIWQLTQEKGYARAADIAQRLGISPASVSRMVQKSHASGQVTHERYRGLSLTPQGSRRGRRLFERHQVLATFLEVIGFEDGVGIRTTVEGIEHFFGPEELCRVQRFLDFMDAEHTVYQAWTAWQAAHPLGEGCR